MEKIVFLGGNGVGKTSFIERLHSGSCVDNSSGSPSPDYERTTEGKTTHPLSLPNRRCVMIELVDTTGAQTNLGDDIRNMHIVFGDAFVVMFSVNDRTSFNTAQEFLKEVARVKITLQQRKSVPLLLLGTYSGESDSIRQVSVAEGRWLASSYWDCSYRETSNRVLNDVKLMEGWMLNELVLHSCKESNETGLLTIFKKLFSKASKKVRRRSATDIDAPKGEVETFRHRSSTFPTSTLPRHGSPNFTTGTLPRHRSPNFTTGTLPRHRSPNFTTGTLLRAKLSAQNEFAPDTRDASFFRVMTCNVHTPRFHH